MDEPYPKWRSDRPPPLLAPEPSEPHFVRSERPHAHGVKRALKIGGAIVGTGVTFVVATAAGALLHLGLPPTRRLAAAGVSQALASSFYGKIAIARIDGLSPTGVDGVVATIATPDGRRVLLVEGVHARIRLWKLLGSMVGGDAMQIDVRELSIDHVDALLEQNDEGAFTIAEALEPLKEGPPEPKKPGSKGTDLAFESIALKHAWVHGGLAAVPVIDADLDDLAASFGTTARETRVDLRRLRMSTRGLPKHADLGAELEAHLVLPVTNAVDDALGSIAFVGAVGGIDFGVHGTKEGRRVDATIDVPRVAPSELDRLLGASPVHEVTGARIEAHGTLPAIDPSLHATIGRGTIDVDGHVIVPMDGRTETRANVTLAARAIDVRAFSPTAAPATLGADARIEARMGNAGPIASGTLHVDAPGSPADVSFDYRGGAAKFDARVRAADLSRVGLLGPKAKGRAIVHADGVVGLVAKTVKAHVETNVDDLALGSIGVAHAVVDGVVSGPLDAPRLGVHVDGNGLRAGGLAIPVFGVSVDGSPEDALVSAKIEGNERTPEVLARARVHAKGGFEAKEIEVDLARGNDRVSAMIDDVRSKNGALDVEGLRVIGAGDPLTGEAHVRAGRLQVKLASGGLDLPTLVRVTGADAGAMKSGKASIDVDLDATKQSTRGHVALGLRDATLEGAMRAMNADVAVQFDGRDAQATIRAGDREMGELRLATENAKLAGGLLDPKAVPGATGRVHLAGKVDLKKLSQSWVGDFPLDDAAGWITAKGDIARDDAAKRPRLSFALSTQDLAFTTRPKTIPNDDGTVTVVGQPFHTEKADANLKAAFDAETGQTSLDAALKDSHGPLLTTNVSTTLPMAAILGGGAKEALLRTPIKAHVEVPIRAIHDLPPALGPQPVDGAIGVALDFAGTARDPRLVLLARARDIRDTDDATPVPVTFDTALTYDGKALQTHLVAVRPEGKVLDATGTVTLRVADLLDGRVPQWDADADVRFSKFPVGCVADFAKEEMDGDLSGFVTLKGLHKAAKLEANLDLSKVQIEGAKFDHAAASLGVHDGVLAASARIEQKDAYADVRARGAMKWGEAIAPSMDPSKPIDVGFVAHDFRAAAVAPFVQGALSELDGRINADTTLHVDPGFKNGKMSGAIVIDHGVFESPMIGEEFHDVKAKIIMRPWGVWRIDDLEAQGVTGKMRANALAHVDGLHLKGAEAHVRIAENEKVPLTLQGAAMGSAWGSVDVTAKAPDERTLDVDVRVPHLQIDLPQSTPHAVQGLSPDPTIKVGVHERDGRVAILPLTEEQAKQAKQAAEPKKDEPKAPPMHMHVDAHLDDIVLKRDTTMKVYVKGEPKVDITDKTKVSGHITVPRGFIELQGKKFVIEKGLVNFDGQPTDDPIVIATARYEANDGTKIFADFVGPVKTGKVTLRSEPSLSQNEIVSVLLFGSSDGTFGQSPPPGQDESGAAKAAGLAGGVVTQGINKALSGVSGVEVATKVDTSESQNPRPEIQVGLSEKVSATVTYNLGVPPPGQNPDTTLLTVDWRFHKHWSTDATIGDKGTSILDFTWKYRY